MQWHLLYSLLVFSHFHCYAQANWALLVLSPGWVGLCRTLWVSPNDLSCEAGSLSCCCPNPHMRFQSEV